MRIFLAGATGVIGRRLAPLLVDRGHSVTGFVRRDADADWLRSLGAKAVRGDVFDADGVRRAVALAAPDVVMLCAPGQEMLVYVDDEELEQRRDRRAPRPAGRSL